MHYIVFNILIKILEGLSTLEPSTSTIMGILITLQASHTTMLVT